MEYWLTLICYLISFLLICFLGSIFLIKNENCPECLRSNKTTHVSLIIIIIILSYFNVIGFVIALIFGLISYLIADKILGGK